ncbi:hypothetical protein [Gimesia alba]|uniref:hypothetical protein n=1 Tax=Gimesia alba TaxID=2527973 RepID=UPI0036F247E1
MLRGGSWNNNADNCRSAYRNRNTPDNRNNTIGFRLCRVIVLPESFVMPDVGSAAPWCVLHVRPVPRGRQVCFLCTHPKRGYESVSFLGDGAEAAATGGGW